jgi:hypothetical protein
VQGETSVQSETSIGETSINDCKRLSTITAARASHYCTIKGDRAALIALKGRLAGKIIETQMMEAGIIEVGVSQNDG